MLRSLSISEQISLSVKNTFKAFEVIRTAKLNWVFLTPIVVFLILFVLGFSLTNTIYEKVIVWIEAGLESWVEAGGFLSTIFSATAVLTWIIIKISLFILFAIFSGYITLIVLAPLLTYVSEKIDESVSGKKYPFNLTKFFRDLFRAIYIALRNGMMQALFTILFIFIGFIPGLNIIAIPGIFIISAYYYGFSFIDYSFERSGLTINQGIQEVKRLKFVAFTLGSIFLLMNMIPWIGMFVSTLIIFPLVGSATLVIRGIDDSNGEMKIENL